MTTQEIEYDVIGKAVVERGNNHLSYALKLLYKGDGTPWWTCSASLDLPVSESFYNACHVGGKIKLSLEPKQ